MFMERMSNFLSSLQWPDFFLGKKYSISCSFLNIVVLVFPVSFIISKRGKKEELLYMLTVGWWAFVLV